MVGQQQRAEGDEVEDRGDEEPPGGLGSAAQVEEDVPEGVEDVGDVGVVGAAGPDQPAEGPPASCWVSCAAKVPPTRSRC